MPKIAYVKNEQELRAAINAHGQIPLKNNHNSEDIVGQIYLTNNIGLIEKIDLPALTYQHYKGLNIDMCGCTIYDNSVDGLPYLIGRKPKDQKDALNVYQSWSLNLKNGKLLGKQKAGTILTGTLLDLGATFNSVVENVQLQCAKNGIVFRFCLMGHLKNIMSNGIENDAIYVGIGDWPGAGRNSSQSNHTVIEQCRVFNHKNSNSAFKVESSSGIFIKNCISEGYSPKYHIYWEDNAFTTTVLDRYIESFHVESPDGGTIYMNIMGGYIDMKSVYTQYPLIIEMGAFASPTEISLSRIMWWPKGSFFKVIGDERNLALRLSDCSSVIDPRNPAQWIGGSADPITGVLKGMPRYISFDNKQNNKVTQNTSIRYNGLLIDAKAPLNVTINEKIKLLEPTKIIVDCNSGNNDGGAYITHRGVVVKKNVRGSINNHDFKTIDGGGESPFTATVEGLTPNTSYTIRTYALNSKGCSYSKEILFKTPE
jgi:hypothetical protein